MQTRYNYRRNLPHLQPDHKTFFVTFCTAQRWILPGLARDIVVETCIRGNGHRYELHALVVMPDHVHLALSPRRDEEGRNYSIPEIMQEIKSVSAHRINKQTHYSGKVWQDESFDRAMRSAEDLDLKIEYMIDNPVRAGIVESATTYRWIWVETVDSRAADSTGGAPVPPSRWAV